MRVAANEPTPTAQTTTAARIATPTTYEPRVRARIPTTTATTASIVNSPMNLAVSNDFNVSRTALLGRQAWKR